MWPGAHQPWRAARGLGWGAAASLGVEEDPPGHTLRGQEEKTEALTPGSPSPSLTRPTRQFAVLAGGGVWRHPPKARASAYLGGRQGGRGSSRAGVRGQRWSRDSAGHHRVLSAWRQDKGEPETCSQAALPPQPFHPFPSLTELLSPPRVPARLPGRSGLRPSAARYRGGGVLLARWLGEKRGCARPGEQGTPRGGRQPSHLMKSEVQSDTHSQAGPEPTFPRCTAPRNLHPLPRACAPCSPGGPALGAAGRKGDGRLWAGRASPSPVGSQAGGGSAPYTMSGLGIVGAAGCGHRGQDWLRSTEMRASLQPRQSQ